MAAAPATVPAAHAYGSHPRSDGDGVPLPRPAQEDLASPLDGRTRHDARGTVEIEEMQAGGASSNDADTGATTDGAHPPGNEANLLRCFWDLSGSPPLDWQGRLQCLRMIQFLRACSYPAEDVAALLAHASAYFMDLNRRLHGRLNGAEASNIMVAFGYIAHSYVLDETCSLANWHRFLCGQYCELKTFDAAVIRLMKLRGYVLRLSVAELERRYAALHYAATASTFTVETRAAPR